MFLTSNFFSRRGWRTLAGCESIHIYPDLPPTTNLQSFPLNGGGTGRV
jgi:hypothetical protein